MTPTIRRSHNPETDSFLIFLALERWNTFYAPFSGYVGCYWTELTLRSSSSVIIRYCSQWKQSQPSQRSKNVDPLTFNDILYIIYYYQWFDRRCWWWWRWWRWCLFLVSLAANGWRFVLFCAVAAVVRVPIADSSANPPQIKLHCFFLFFLSFFNFWTRVFGWVLVSFFFFFCSSHCDSHRIT